MIPIKDDNYDGKGTQHQHYEIDLDQNNTVTVHIFSPCFSDRSPRPDDGDSATIGDDDQQNHNMNHHPHHEDPTTTPTPMLSILPPPPRNCLEDNVNHLRYQDINNSDNSLVVVQPEASYYHDNNGETRDDQNHQHRNNDNPTQSTSLVLPPPAKFLQHERSELSDDSVHVLSPPIVFQREFIRRVEQNPQIRLEHDEGVNNVGMIDCLAEFMPCGSGAPERILSPEEKVLRQIYSANAEDDMVFDRIFRCTSSKSRKPKLKPIGLRSRQLFDDYFRKKKMTTEPTADDNAIPPASSNTNSSSIVPNSIIDQDGSTCYRPLEDYGPRPQQHQPIKSSLLRVQTQTDPNNIGNHPINVSTSKSISFLDHPQQQQQNPRFDRAASLLDPIVSKSASMFEHDPKFAKSVSFAPSVPGVIGLAASNVSNRMNHVVSTVVSNLSAATADATKHLVKHTYSDDRTATTDDDGSHDPKLMYAEDDEEYDIRSHIPSKKPMQFLDMIKPFCKACYQKLIVSGILYFMIFLITSIGLIYGFATRFNWPYIASSWKRTFLQFLYHHHLIRWDKNLSIAFIGSSYLFANDVPRLMETLSEYHIRQQSCIHAGGSLSDLLTTGNGMFKLWRTDNALITNTDENLYQGKLYDYGLCSVQQILNGTDPYMAYYNRKKVYYNDGLNPCLVDKTYSYYITTESGLGGNNASSWSTSSIPKWDYIVLADQTKRMAVEEARNATVESLIDSYGPLIAQTNAVPVIVDTHAFWSDSSNMTGLDSIPTFTQYIYDGVADYIDALKIAFKNEAASSSSSSGSSSRRFMNRPIVVAPIGLAYLTIWEENYNIWEALFIDNMIHPSLLGSYLFGCVLYATVYGHLPKGDITLFGTEHDSSNHNLQSLFTKSRRLLSTAGSTTGHKSSLYPNTNELEYLLDVTNRVALKGYVPNSFYDNNDDGSSSSNNNNSNRRRLQVIQHIQMQQQQRIDG